MTQPTAPTAAPAEQELPACPLCGSPEGKKYEDGMHGTILVSSGKCERRSCGLPLNLWQQVARGPAAEGDDHRDFCRQLACSLDILDVDKDCPSTDEILRAVNQRRKQLTDAREALRVKDAWITKTGHIRACSVLWSSRPVCDCGYVAALAATESAKITGAGVEAPASLNTPS